MSKYRFLEDKHIHQIDRGNGWENLHGTTTVLGIISKDLVWWSSQMAVGTLGWLHKFKDKDGDIPKGDKERVAARQNERLVTAGAKLTDIKSMEIKEYLDLLDTAYRAHNAKKEARAQEGTDLHSLAESYIKFTMDGVTFGRSMCLAEDWIRLTPFMEWCQKNVKRFLFSEIHCYSEKLWVGGKTDFAYEGNDGNYVLADIKSRDKSYFSDHVQVGGYDIQLCENGGFDKDGNLTWDFKKSDDGGDLIAHGFSKHAIFTLGENFKEPAFSDPQKNKEAFESALNLYKSKNLWDKEHGEWR